MTFRNRRLSIGAAVTLTTLIMASLLALLLTHAPGAGAKSRATVRLAKTSLGPILVSASGSTLYAFSRDGRNQDRCLAISGCTSLWPILTTAGKPVAGAGVKGSLLGSIRLPHRSVRQVTYAGHALYTYSADAGRAATDYVGVTQFGGKWLALNSAGKTKG